MIVLIVVFSVLAMMALVVSVSVLLGRRQATLERRLAGYERADVAAVVPGTEGVTSTPGVTHAVDLTGRLAERAGLLKRVERALEQSDLPVRASELIFYVAVGSIAAFLLLGLFFNWVVGVGAGAFVAIGAVSYVSHRQRGRAAVFERQLPDTLTLLASSLRAGFSFMQGLETVAQEIGSPMRRELQRVFTEVRLGREPEDALGDAAERMDSRDLAWTVMAIKIQREVGGNLATLLDTVADTMQKRERIRREVHALTAEGRLSAIILGLLPPLAGLGLALVAPDYMQALFDSAIGWAAVIGGAVLALLGMLWLRKITQVEV
jgi:tight adherence protein B